VPGGTSMGERKRATFRIIVHADLGTTLADHLLEFVSPKITAAETSMMQDLLSTNTPHPATYTDEGERRHGTSGWPHQAFLRARASQNLNLQSCCP